MSTSLADRTDDPRVVDEAGDRAELGGGVEQPVDAGRVGRVQLDGDRAGAGGLDRRGDLARPVGGRAIADDDVVALGREPRADRRADAASAAGHDGDVLARNLHTGNHMVMDLPEDLTLPLERGAPWWYWLGGRPALDFTNTLRERWRRRVETLVTVEDLSEWLVAAGLLSTPPVVADALLVRARELREAIDAGVTAVLAGRPVPDAALAVIAREVPAAVTGEEAVRADDGSVALRPAAPLIRRRTPSA